MIRVTQLLSGAGPHDAITNEAIAFRAAFARWGWGGEDLAHRIAPGADDRILDASRLVAAPDDVLLLHHSAAFPRLESLLALPNPKLLLYHNVTPADWLWDVAPYIAVQCAAGRAQLTELVAAVDLSAADSSFNADELLAAGASGAEVIPLLVELGRLAPPDAPDGAPGGPPTGVPDSASGGPPTGVPAGAPGGPPTVLFVGRLSPHKRQEELIRVFALLRRHRRPDARLRLVGDPISDAYREHLQRLADGLAPGAVTIESGLAPAALAERYREADAFVCLSAHEGFCIPLLEAFHFGVPVLARRAGAVPEVVGDAAVLVEETDPAVLAEAIHLLLADAELRSVLRGRGTARLAAFAPEVVERRLRAAVERTVDAHRGRMAA